MFSTSGGWEFSSKRGRGVTGKKIKDGPREGGTKVRQQKYRCIGHFWSRDRIAGILQVDGGTKDINDKRSVSTRTFLHSQAGQECRIWV